MSTGDSGYPNTPWLLTPIRDPTTPGEVCYNEAHVKTRRPIERTFGLLKSRFRCLDKSGGALLYSPGKVCYKTIVCCMLHNLALRRDIPIIDDEAQQYEPPAEDVEDAHGEDSGDEEGHDIHQEIITNCFSWLPVCQSSICYTHVCLVTL